MIVRCQTQSNQLSVSIRMEEDILKEAHDLIFSQIQFTDNQFDIIVKSSISKIIDTFYGERGLLYNYSKADIIAFTNRVENECLRRHGRVVRKIENQKENPKHYYGIRFLPGSDMDILYQLIQKDAKKGEKPSKKKVANQQPDIYYAQQQQNEAISQDLSAQQKRKTDLLRLKNQLIELRQANSMLEKQLYKQESEKDYNEDKLIQDERTIRRLKEKVEEEKPLSSLDISRQFLYFSQSLLQLFRTIHQQNEYSFTRLKLGENLSNLDQLTLFLCSKDNSVAIKLKSFIQRNRCIEQKTISSFFRLFRHIRNEWSHKQDRIDAQFLIYCYELLEEFIKYIQFDRRLAPHQVQEQLRRKLKLLVDATFDVRQKLQEYQKKQKMDFAERKKNLKQRQL